MNNSFAGLPWEPIAVDIWSVTSAAQALGDPPQRMAAAGRGLSAGAPYELEGTIAHTAQRAILAGAVVESSAAHAQQRDLKDHRVLLERSVRITRHLPRGLPALYTADRTTRVRFGLPRADVRATLNEESEALRAMVTTLRGYGWEGAIILPGPITEALTVLVPRAELISGRVAIAQSGRRQVPREAVEHVLGVRMLPDIAASSGAMQTSANPLRAAGRGGFLSVISDS